MQSDISRVIFALTVFAVVWLSGDWFNSVLNNLPLTKGLEADLTGWLVTLAAIPFILLVNLLALPGALVGGAPVLIALAVICGLMSGGLWLYRRRQTNLQ